MKLQDVQLEINNWIENFLEIGHPSLGGRSPCPFARSARLKKSYEVRLGTDAYSNLCDVGQQGIGDKEVIIYAYPREFYTPSEFQEIVEQVNLGFLIPVDLIALDDHPDHVEEVNGVQFNQGSYTLALIQSLSDLNKKSQAMAEQGFYNEWPDEYLDDLFKHRLDHRK